MTDLDKLNAATKARKIEEAGEAGWHCHTEYHWFKMLKGKRLDYWPSKSKFQYDGVVMQGDVDEFISTILRGTNKSEVVPPLPATHKPTPNFTVMQALATLRTEVLGLESPDYAMQLIERIEAEHQSPAVSVPDDVRMNAKMYDDNDVQIILTECSEAIGCVPLTNLWQISRWISSPRITEQDAEAIVNSAVNFMYWTKSRHSIDYWLFEEGRALLDKLNTTPLGQEQL